MTTRTPRTSGPAEPPTTHGHRLAAAVDTVTPELLERMTQAIVDEVDPEQVILFGSRGRGEERPGSDVDLLVIEAAPFGPERSRHKEMLRLARAVRKFRVPKDVLVFSKEDVEYWHDSLNHVLARALREGRVLYRRTSGDDARRSGAASAKAEEGA